MLIKTRVSRFTPELFPISLDFYERVRMSENFADNRTTRSLVFYRMRNGWVSKEPPSRNILKSKYPRHMTYLRGASSAGRPRGG